MSADVCYLSTTAGIPEVFIYIPYKDDNCRLLVTSILCTKNGQFFSVKGQTVAISGFASHMTFTAATQLCGHSRKAAVDDM